MRGPLRIMLADDHEVVRAGIRLLLDREHDMTVVAEAGDGGDTLRRAVEERPDLLLLDLTMPRTDAMETIRGVRRDSPATAIVILTVHAEPAFVAAALAAGASGYVVKTSPTRELLSAIRSASRGESYVDSALRPSLPGSLPARKAGAASLLSPRETQVVRLLSLGYTNAQVGERLRISRKTVETFRARVRRKLQVRDRAGLVRFALGTGLVNLAELAASAAEGEDPAPA
jgi:two-component system, NarL family, response regulator NreC